MKKAIISATAVLALCAIATSSTAAPTTGSDNRPEAGEKGPNGGFASSQKGGMGGHASDGKNSRE